MVDPEAFELLWKWFRGRSALEQTLMLSALVLLITLLALAGK